MSTKLAGLVTGLFITPPGNLSISHPLESVAVSIDGFVGDKHSGITRFADGRTPQYPRGTVIWNDRQITIVSEEELREISSTMGIPEVRSEWLGANMTIVGIPRFTLLAPMTRIYFQGGVTLICTGINRPCKSPGKLIESKFPENKGIAKLFPKVAFNCRGITVVVEKPGLLANGESFDIRLDKVESG
jgi:hypothetical protein